MMTFKWVFTTQNGKILPKYLYIWNQLVEPVRMRYKVPYLGNVAIWPHSSYHRCQEYLQIQNNHRWRIFQQHDSKRNLAWLCQSICPQSNWSFYATSNDFINYLTRTLVQSWKTPRNRLESLSKLSQSVILGYNILKPIPLNRHFYLQIHPKQKENRFQNFRISFS